MRERERERERPVGLEGSGGGTVSRVLKEGEERWVYDYIEEGR